MDKVSTHITCEQLADQQIVAYEVAAIDVQSLQDWSQHIVATLSTWTGNEYLALHDLSRGVSIPLLVLTHFNILDPGLTKAGQAQVEQILSQKPNLYIRLAVVLPLTTSGRLARVRARHSAEVDHIESIVFYNREVALKWLKGFIPNP
ncbi:MAG: hypothetical protein U0694_21690 [Anaerolineae bacterium]